MRKIAKILVLSLLTVSMAVGCGKKPARSSDNVPSSQEVASSNPSSDVSSNPASSSDNSVAPSSASEGRSSSNAPSSDVKPDSSSAAPSSSAQPSSSSQAPSSSAQPSSSSQAPSSSAQPSSSEAPVTTGISLNTDAVKKTYTVGEALDTTGLIVNANMSDGSSLPVTDFTTNPANGTVLNETGKKDIGVNYLTFNATFEVTVNPAPKELTGISLNTDNVKKEYYQGENLDLTGLIVNALYDDNSSEEVTDYTTTPANGSALNVIGEKYVVVEYNGFEDDFAVNVNEPPKSAWTEEEAAIMREHLYGQVLPYNGLEESVVSYNSTYDIVVIAGGAISLDELGDYAELLEDNGYEIYGGDGSEYGLEKPIMTSAGLRYINIYLATDEGEFYLEASDPYIYEFPADYAAEFADVFGSSEVPPAFEAIYYEVSESNLAIYCYCEADSDDCGYGDILAEAGWDVGDEKAANGYYYAVSPDGLYMIYFLYDSSYGDLDIIFMPLNFWNDALIDAFFLSYGTYTVDIPAYEGASQYVFQENPYNEDYYEYGYYQYISAYMVIYGVDATSVNAYAAILAEAGWNASNGYATLLIPDVGVAQIEFEYDSDYSALVITIYWMLGDLPAAEWPADEIAAFLGDDVTDVVPEFDGENNGFTVLNDSYGFAVQVGVEAGTELDALDSYVAILTNTDNNYTEYGEDAYGDMQYLSANSQILVCPYVGTSGSITISIAKFVAFPYEEVEAYLADIGTFTDEVIGMDGADSYYIYSDGTYVQAQCYYSSEELARAALEAYTDIIEATEYEYLGLDTSGRKNYESPNEEFYIAPWVYVNDYNGQYILVLNIIPGVFEAPAVGWPIDELTAALGAALASEIPVYDNSLIYGVSTNSEYADLLIYCAVPDKSAAAEEYRDILKEAGWTENGKDSYGDMHYLSPSKKLDLNPTDGYTGDNFYIEVNLAPATEWPTDEVAALCARNYCENDTIPALEGGSAYQISEQYSFADAAIMITIENSSTAAAAYEEALVEDYGWELTGTDSYGQNIFTSPNEELTVSLYVPSGYIYMEINWLNTPATPTIEWPAENVAAFLNANGTYGEITDELPAFPNLTDIAYVGNYTYADVAIYCYCDDPAGARDAYEDILDEAGWDFVGTSYGQNVFASPDGQLTVSCYVQSSAGRVTLEINFLEPEEPPVEDKWPTADLADLFDEFGFEDELPAFAGEYESASVAANDEAITISVVIDGDEEDFDDAITEYCFTLEDAGFDYITEDAAGVHYMSVNNEFEVVVGMYGEGIFIKIYEYIPVEGTTYTSFPMEEIVSYYPTAADCLPTIAGGEGISFFVDASSDQDYYILQAYYPSVDAATTAYEAYIDALEDAGFTTVDVWGMHEGYMSPDGEFVVIVYDSGLEDSFLAIDIMTAGIL